MGRNGLERSQDDPAQVELTPRYSRSPILVVLAGPPGTGKSHLARMLAAEFPFRIVQSDEIRRAVAHPRTYTAEENRTVFGIAHQTIGRLLGRGIDVLYDATNIRESSRRSLRRIATSAGARVLFVQVTAPDEVVRQRLARRALGKDPLDHSEAGWETYQRMKAEFEEIRGRHLLVDTSGDLEGPVRMILRFVRGEP